MEFTSTLFLFLFLPVFLLIYLVASPHLKLPIVLVASIIFLTWGGGKVALLWLAGILVSGYGIGIVIARQKEKGNASSIFLWGGIAVNVAILFLFKYSVAYGEGGFGWL